MCAASADPQRKYYVFLIFCLLLAFMSVCIGLLYGSVAFNSVSLWDFMTDNLNPSYHIILTQVRMPLMVNAFLVGGLLALAGVLMQVLLRNPLADPYILGVSGGAACVTLLGMLFGVSFFWLHILSYLGALIAMVLVFAIARTPKYWSSLRLLLTGVVIAAGWGALISFILSLSPDSDLHGLLFWLIGNISTLQISYTGLIVLLAGCLLSLYFAKPMDLVLQGETFAKMLGVNVKALYLFLFCVSAVLTATAVSIAGTIGFIGLVIPHVVRLCVGSRHKFLIPASILLGGSLLILADTLARSLFSPLELPVGIFTVFIGVPVFLVLLIKSKSL